MRTPSQPKVENKKNNALKIVIGLFILIISLFVILDLHARYKFSSLKNEVDKVRSTMEPLEAVYQPTRSPSGGNGLLSTLNCWPDTLCPFVYGGWIVPLEAGTEGKLAKTVLESQGYSLDKNVAFSCADIAMVDACAQFGTKGERHMKINMFTANTAHFDNMPEKDISPKVWRYVEIYVADYQSYNPAQ